MHIYIIVNTLDTSNKLLTRLSNILYFDNMFNGLFFISPLLFFILSFNHIIICQSPLIHLWSLDFELLYPTGYPSISIISVANPHRK